MGALEDTIGEFKKAKPPEKLLIVGSVVAVVGIAWYVHNQNAAAGSPAQGATPASSGPGGISSGGQQSGWPSVPAPGSGQIPVLPQGYSPIFDPNGNLIGYGPTPPGGTTPPGGGSPGGGTPPGGGSPGGGTPPGGGSPGGGTPQLQGNPLIPLGQYNGPNYSNLKPGTTYSYGGTNYFLQPGSQGRLWGTPVSGGQQVLLYGPPSAYTPKQGGGAFGTRVLGQHGKRIAPTVEGHSYVARVYGRRRMN